MRALLVGAAPVNTSPERLWHLASCSDVVVGVDGGAGVLLAAGITPTLLIGDMDSIEPAVLAKCARNGIALETYPRDKDHTDLSLALDWCSRNSVDEVTACGVIGGRLDHSLAALGELSRFPELRPRVESDEALIWLLAKPQRESIDLSGRGACVSVVALLGPAIVTGTGLKWEFRQLELSALDGRGLSNVISEDSARVEVHAGCVAVISYTVDGVEPATETPAE